jgi:hypothetical protein
MLPLRGQRVHAYKTPLAAHFRRPREGHGQRDGPRQICLIAPGGFRTTDLTIMSRVRAANGGEPGPFKGKTAKTPLCWGGSRADITGVVLRCLRRVSAMRYKTPAIVNLDFTATFTPALLYKDFHLGFEAAEEHGVPMPVAAAASRRCRR